MSSLGAYDLNLANPKSDQVSKIIQHPIYVCLFSSIKDGV